MAAFDLPPLEAWSFQTVVDLVRAHEFEPGHFDYKSVLTGSGPQRDEVLKSIQRTACSLANADGGYILFGVKDRREQVRTPDERVVGFLLGGDLRKQFGDKLQQIQPELHFETSPAPLLLPSDSSRGLFVVLVPLSPLRPHRAPDGVFYRRGDGGSAVAMSYYEVRDQMLYTDERLRRATLLRLEITQYRDQVRLIRELGDKAETALLRFDTGAFKVLLADTCSLLPPDNALLADLLRIPMLANLVNAFLERSTYPGARFQQAGVPDPNIMYRASILSNLSSLDDLCAQCGHRLEALLGPLTTAGLSTSPLSEAGDRP